MKNPIGNLNKVFDSRIRMGVMSILLMNAEVSFNELKQLLELTDGNLASHLINLEENGFVKVHKGFIGRKTNTTYSITKAGEKAFKDHLQALGEHDPRCEWDLTSFFWPMHFEIQSTFETINATTLLTTHNEHDKDKHNDDGHKTMSGLTHFRSLSSGLLGITLLIPASYFMLTMTARICSAQKALLFLSPPLSSNRPFTCSNFTKHRLSSAR